MDKRLIDRFSRYYKSQDIQKNIGERLIELCYSDFYNILEIGCGDGCFTKMLKRRFPFSKITSLDISEKLVRIAKNEIKGINFIVGDGEMLPFKTHFDLIISNASFQWFSSLEESLLKFKDNLSEKGVLLFSIFGSNTLKELSESLKMLFKNNIKIRASSFPSKDNIKETLRKVSSFLFIKDESFKKEYSSLKELLLSIRYSSYSNIIWTKGILEKLERLYQDKFNGIFATYEVFLIFIKNLS